MYAYVETCTCISWAWQTYRLCKTSVCNWISYLNKIEAYRHSDAVISLVDFFRWKWRFEFRRTSLNRISSETRSFSPSDREISMPCKLFHKYSACEFFFSRHSIIALILNKILKFCWIHWISHSTAAWSHTCHVCFGRSLLFFIQFHHRKIQLNSIMI